MNGDEVQALLREAIRRLIRQEWDLAVVGANERTITGHLGRFLTEALIGGTLSVDNDYNRHLLDPKRAWLDNPTMSNETLIEPDIVIHRRGLDEENLLALEAKKARRCTPHDELKIKALVAKPFLYNFGVLLGFGLTTHKDDSYWRPAWQWFTEFERYPDYVDVFDEGLCQELNVEGRDMWHQRL